MMGIIIIIIIDEKGRRRQRNNKNKNKHNGKKRHGMAAKMAAWHRISNGIVIAHGVMA